MRVHFAEGVVGARPGARPHRRGAIDYGGVDVAHVQVAVRQLHLEVVGHVVGDAGMERPGEVPFGESLAVAEAGGAVGDEADIVNRRDVVIARSRRRRRRTASGTSRCRDRYSRWPSTPRPSGCRHRRRSSGRPGRIGVAADRLELRLGAVFGGGIEAQPRIPLIAETAADEARRRPSRADRCASSPATRTPGWSG